MVKIERSYPPPESLKSEAKKSSGSYSKPDVVEQLRKDFFNKCYICELDNLQDPQVEHLYPHKNGKYPERKFDWDNLFWACGHCNLVKNHAKYDEGILDCCKVDPEKVISFTLASGDVYVNPRNIEDKKAALTAELVTEVFNLKNTGMRTYKSEMRLKQLTKEMNKLFDSLEEIQQFPNSKVAKRKIAALLERKSRFAAFKRNYIREHQAEYPMLIRYIE